MQLLPSTFFSLVLAAATPAAHLRSLPRLGDPIPAAILKTRPAHRTCETSDHHRDPCADVRIRRDRITVAWDASTGKVTFLYSTTLLTDSELAAHGTGRIDPSIPLIPFHAGFISADWCDTDHQLSGDALWCAVMKPSSEPRYGLVIGFVQSIYLLLPNIDAQPRHRAALEPGPHPSLAPEPPALALHTVPPPTPAGTL